MGTVQHTQQQDDIADPQIATRVPMAIVRSLVNNNIRPLRSRNSKGHWTGKRGNSFFILDDDAQFPLSSRGDEMITGAQLKNKYGTDGILYHGFEPIFLPFRDRMIDTVRVDNMPFTRDKKGGSYDIAAQTLVDRGLFPNKKAVRDYMKENNLVWHECGDCHTIIAIPWHLNAIFSHTGAIGIVNQMNELSTRVRKRGSLVLNKQGLYNNGSALKVNKIYRRKK